MPGCTILQLDSHIRMTCIFIVLFSPWVRVGKNTWEGMGRKYQQQNLMGLHCANCTTLTSSAFATPSSVAACSVLHHLFFQP